MIVDGKQQAIDQLRELAEFFDDPKRTPHVGLQGTLSRMTPGFLLRSIANSYEAVDSGAENVGSG